MLASPSPVAQEAEIEEEAAEVDQTMPRKRTKTQHGSSARTTSVVKVFVKKAPCSYTAPWRKESQTACTGTGFLINGRMIITNAHVTHRQTSVLVRAQVGVPIKFVAKVLCVALPLDLCILTVDDEKFWQGKQMLPLYEGLPQLDANVTCVGYPVGGDNISVTRGVVSRIDIYGQGLLRIQIDAAINPGNSGGPVFDERGHVIGVATSHLRNATNIGYLIPVGVVKLFLQSYEAHGFYRGVPSLGLDQVQVLENVTLRKVLQLPDSETGGVRVVGVHKLGPSRGLLLPDDVILSIDGEHIGQDGTVELRQNERISFHYLVTRKNVGERLQLGIYREGQFCQVTVQLQPVKFLIPRLDGFDCEPQYFVYGGLVFVPLTTPWTNRKKNAFPYLSYKYCGMLDTEGQEIVVLSKVLAHPVNFGYHNLSGVALAAVNGQCILNLADLAQKVSEHSGPVMEFTFDDSICQTVEEAKTNPDAKVHKRQVRVCLDVAACAESEPEIFGQHMIASRISPPAALPIHRAFDSLRAEANTASPGPSNSTASPSSSPSLHQSSVVSETSQSFQSSNSEEAKRSCS